MARYAADPRWITTRYPGECKGCRSKIPKGARVYYFPRSRTILCESCGEPEAARFNAEAWDEDNNTCL